ncbi:flagellar hook-associated protein FlgL [Halarcobacter anaerophilus]|uniref:Flagellar hook-associated protein 3 n=1 Tax=Halarcobacter anaerophilus TaxID=877500 RepID=A0A4Q0Y2I2_9BACT|nr:flagellar hook-associated protein FlgL [Halarcobacter anaerophilus]QDF29064.1 distal flagellar hook-filament junction protein FlgL [Halarcobacter anaerophilus]RXJ63695.1 flagellar hook-associated protein 3 [Halarcobacter anaerophilus]
MIKSLDAITYNLSILDERNHKVNTALSTKEALEYGSDDSIKYSYIISLQGDINSYSSIQDNITLSKAFNSSSDSALKEAKDVTDEIIAKLIEANTDTTADEDREVIATELEDSKNVLLSLANTKVNGQYLFSGINTDTKPFVTDSVTGQTSYQSDNSTKTLNVEKATYVSQGVNGIDAFYYENAAVGSTDTFTFSANEKILDPEGNEWQLIDSGGGVYELYLNGDTSSTPISVTDNGDGTFTATNSTSSTLSVQHSIFDALDEVIAALKLQDTDGNTISSAAARDLISTGIDNIKSAYDSQNIAHSTVGSRTAAINTYNDVVSSKLTNLKSLEEEYAGADLTALAIESKALENTYTALYSTINRMNNMSLVNFLS